MQLNVTTDYAIRSMLYLSQVERQASSSEISRAMSIPSNYLYSVMGKLKEAGYVKAARGVNGGWSLVGDPEDITLLDMIVAMEGTIKINACLEDGANCSRDASASCQMHDIYCEVQDQLEGYFASVTLANLRDWNWTSIQDYTSHNRPAGVSIYHKDPNRKPELDGE